MAILVEESLIHFTNAFDVVSCPINSVGVVLSLSGMEVLFAKMERLCLHIYDLLCQTMQVMHP